MKNNFYGKHILENRLAEDYADDISSICGYDDIDSIPKDVLEKNQDEIFEYWKAQNTKKTVYSQAFIVLGYYLARNGCDIKPYIKEKAIEMARVDEYAEINLERQYIMNSLINILENYNNEPSDISLPYTKTFVRNRSLEHVTSIGNIILSMDIPCVKDCEYITGDLRYSEDYTLLLYIDMSVPCNYVIFENIFDVQIMFKKVNI